MNRNDEGKLCGDADFAGSNAELHGATRFTGGSLTGQWLLASEKFQSIVVGQDGLPAPMVCPDPRAFAVYKQWLSEQPDREPAKTPRDRQQAAATLALVREKFPHLALDDNAERMFPAHVRKLSGGSTFEL